MNRCDICIEPDCTKAMCHCDTCSSFKQCPKFLHPTIRITTKCTQQCAHCCFSCSPTSEKMMTVETAEIIAKFLKANGILSLNVMGGEFFCNPDWYPIIGHLLSAGSVLRLVSNADWYDDDVVKDKLAKLSAESKGRLYLSLSCDRWHTNAGVKSAAKYLKAHNIPYTVEDKEQASEAGIVPIGRSESSCGIYSMLACYCHNPQNQYSFMIDEGGVIYKCPFGILDYANVIDYVDGGFNAKFKDFNSKFYSIFIPSCSSCIRMAEIRKAHS